MSSGKNIRQYLLHLYATHITDTRTLGGLQYNKEVKKGNTKQLKLETLNRKLKTNRMNDMGVEIFSTPLATSNVECPSWDLAFQLFQKARNVKTDLTSSGRIFQRVRATAEKDLLLATTTATCPLNESMRTLKLCMGSVWGDATLSRYKDKNTSDPEPP